MAFSKQLWQVEVLSAWEATVLKLCVHLANPCVLASVKLLAHKIEHNSRYRTEVPRQKNYASAMHPSTNICQPFDKNRERCVQALTEQPH